MLFPFNDSSEPREEVNYTLHLNEAKRTGKPYCGVKGPSSLASLIRLPIVPFDQMHLLYLGVVRAILSHAISHKLIDVAAVDNTLINCKVPASFRRKPRPLLFLSKFKATEWKMIILYFHCCFFNPSNDLVKLAVSTLATIIHMLNKNRVSDDDCADARLLIKMFQELCFQIFGKGIQSFSKHALKHLPDQGMQFGDLWATSAFAFESSFHQLKRTLISGTLVER